MKSLLKLLGLLILIVAVIAGSVVAYRRLSARVDPAAVSEPLTDAAQEDAAADPLRAQAPDFTVEDAEGAFVTLQAQRGKPVILNFWATWCPPCRSELGFFEAAYRQYGDQITFMMLDLTDGYRETRAGVEDFLAENGYTFPVYYDTEQSAAVAYGASSIPLTVCVAADGSVVASQVGALHEQALQTMIDALLQ